MPRPVTFPASMAFFCKRQNESIFLYMLVVMAHVEFWFLGLKFSAEDIKDSGAHPSSFGMGHKGEIVRLDMTKTWSTNGVGYMSKEQQAKRIVERGRREKEQQL